MQRDTKSIPPRAPSSRDREDASTLEELSIQLLRRETSQPVHLRTLAREAARHLNSPREGRLESVMASLVERGEVLEFQGSYFLASNLKLVEGRIRDLLRADHSLYPYRLAMRISEVKGRIGTGKSLNSRRKVHPELFGLALDACKMRGEVLEVDEGLRLVSFVVDPAEIQKLSKLQEVILSYIDDRRYHRFVIGKLVHEVGEEIEKIRFLFAGLVKAGKIVEFGEKLYMVVDGFESTKADLVSALTATAVEGRGLTIGEIKSLLGAPRNALIALLEHLDSVGVTRREGNVRVLGSTNPVRSKYSDVPTQPRDGSSPTCRQGAPGTGHRHPPYRPRRRGR